MAGSDPCIQAAAQLGPSNSNKYTVWYDHVAILLYMKYFCSQIITNNYREWDSCHVQLDAF